MSAKINIESDDPHLAAALGFLVAQALQKSHFRNVQAKNVMIAKPITRPGWGRVSVLCEYLDYDKPVMGKGERLPAMLSPLHHVTPPTDFDVPTGIMERYALFDKPVVLSFIEDTCEEYEREVEQFLNPSPPSAEDPGSAEGQV